ncbi:SRPBCC family protein [Nocardioides panacisoli]|uniref:Polyketide cyclase n=1 Tax=Nocardioides panacisoli TaxID=627624 RepID=A0ABP7J6N7_9ACTN
MKRTFTTTRHIDAPAELVWDALFDVARWPAWTPTVSSVERLDDGPLRLGSRARIRQPRLRPAVWEVTELVAGRSFTWVAKGPGVATIGSHRVEPTATGAAVTLGIEQTGPMGALAALFWGGLTQRYIETEATSLDARVTGAPTA